MKIARMLGATAVLFVSLTLSGSPMAFANAEENSSSGSSSGSSGSSGGSSGDSSGSFTSGSDSSGSDSSGSDSSGSDSTGGDSTTGTDTSGSSHSCDSACQKRKNDRKKKTTEPQPTSVIDIPPQTTTPRAPVRRYTPVAPPVQNFVPDVPAAPAETPVLEQDAVSRSLGELLPAGASVPVAGSSPTADTTSATEDGEPGAATPGPQLTSEAKASVSGGTSPPWTLIGGGLAVGLLGAGLAFAPSRKPPLSPPPMNPANHYPGY